MSKIDELIQQYCPEGVEYVRLDSICSLVRGRVMSKDYLRDNAGVYPVYSSQTANKGVFGYINSFDFDCESITWTTDEANAGSLFFHNKEQFSITNVCGLLRVLDNNTINSKFIYYVLLIVAKGYVYSGMGNPKLMSNIMGTIRIPIPPFLVQQEIVRIFNKFTELEAELEARVKQYEYSALKTTGTDIDKILPPVSRFGGGGSGRAVKKQSVIEKLLVFFEKYLGLV